ncbi:lysine-rich nucleolar protein 1 isoform X1 [Trachinotus anak]|uniref:lysine-rich nucleolar protein 1 isoform X1 n=2 Tax=Trachinotus anak TaxID=443729 RepID=UPI0039F1B303
MFQTDSDVIFVSEKSAQSREITIDQAKRRALQRDIDQESLPRQPVKPWTNQRPVAGERPVKKVKMKMEEDKSEENHIKKKKHKKGEASVPKNKNCTVDNESLAEVKKEKKKRKEAEAVVIEEELLDGGGEKENKKKKKREIVNESLNDANVCDAMEPEKDGVSKKKKKKKQELADDMNLAQSLKEETDKKQKKEKKVKEKGVQIKAENVTIQKEEEEAVKDKVQKKAKKGKTNILAVSTEVTEEQSKEKKKKKKKSTEEETTVAMDGITETKKKLKVCKNGVKSETPEGETEVEEVKKKKKTKKEAKSEENENGVETLENKENNKKRKVASSKKLNKDDVLNKSESVITEEGETEQRKKGQKEKGKKVPVEVREVEETEPKKKKRKKESLKTKEESLLIKCEENEEDGQSSEMPLEVAGDKPSKKSKKKSSSVQTKQGENDVSAETGAKKKKKKIKKEVEEQPESPQMDVVFLSEKSGNTDEITINQERRQALQMEIDKASQPSKPSKASGFGQWGTAQFDSSEQQQKFLRLMGGFKKGFQPAGASTGKANMAMGKDAQQQLQQGLMGEFERAQSRRMDFSNRGAGLGFAAPSNKKFSIDINTCRSVRFDD